MKTKELIGSQKLIAGCLYLPTSLLRMGRFVFGMCFTDWFVKASLYGLYIALLRKDNLQLATLLVEW